MLNIIVKFLTFGKFYLGKKRDILIFDAAASNFLSLYFEIKQFSFFYSRKEKFEIIAFMVTLFKDGYKNFGRNYFFNYLRIYKPKFIFSMWILNKNLFHVKNNFSNIKVIIVQGNRIVNDDYELLSSYPSNSVDLFFTYRKFDEERIKKILIKSDVIPIGSAKNNHFYKLEKKKEKILFFSEFKVGRFTHDEKTILKILEKYCQLNKIEFDIQLRYGNIPKEYLLSLKRNNIRNFGQLIMRKDFSSSYENSNKYKILVMTNSTLNDEFISNYKKVVVLSSHNDLDDEKYKILNCGKLRKICFQNPMYKEMLPENFSWTSTLNEEIVFKVIDNVMKCNEFKWREHINKYTNRLLYDQNNRIFLNKLKDIGIKSNPIK
tara:strand:+ start:2186 stop:3313 length:1128 start_codon:yes stop_codon:yes gene_type:complete